LKLKGLGERLKITRKKIEAASVKNMSVKMKIWLAFVTFTAMVFILMWLLEVVFLQTFYPVFKRHQTVSAASKIARIYTEDDLDDGGIQQLAFKNNMCVEIIDSKGIEKVKVDVLNGNCVLHGDRVDIYILLNKLTASEKGSLNISMYDNAVQSDVIIYGTIINRGEEDEAYILVDAPLAPVGSIISMIKTQTFYIIAILLVFSLIISIYISNYVSRPIKNLTKAAEQLAMGNYDTRFEGGGYEEIDKLAATLEFAEGEIKKVGMMQRDLIANTSHDLRTPLTMMKAYAEMIRDLSGDDPVKRNKHLQIVIDETDRLTALVNDILDLSKLENGSMELEIKDFDITEKMKSIYSRYVEFSKKKDFHIFFDAPESYIVRCDEGKIERVICNLINNAVNYTAGDRNVYVRERITAEGVLIEVEDTGDGIEEDKIKLIFDKYYRSENHKRETIGTGLGLSIVKTILKMHGYRFGVKSTLGVGTVFWFIISDIDDMDSKK